MIINLRKYILFAFMLYSLFSLGQINPGDEDPDAEDPVEIPINSGVTTSLVIGIGYFLYRLKAQKGVKTV